MMADEIRPKALLLAGPCIAGIDCTPDKFMIPGTKIGVGFIDEPDEADILALIQLAINYHSVQQTADLTKDFKAVKDCFRSGIGQSMADGALSDEVALLKEKDIPILVIFGADDQAIYPDYLDNAPFNIWENEIVKIGGAGHWAHLDEPEIFTKLLADFSVEIFNKADF
jgi:pimeloyl-ACP methyl ester carboxylesterase